MSYGTSAGVAQLTPRYLAEGVYSTTTTPTLATVEAWLSEVSAMMDAALGDKRFETPVTDDDALVMLGAQANGFVAELARAINGHGAFGTAGEDLRPITEIYNKIMTSFAEWLETSAAGLERMGATRLPQGAIDVSDAPTVFVGSFTKVDGYSSSGSEYS